MELQLTRIFKTKTTTIGKLPLPTGEEFYTLEDTIREVPGQSVAQWKIKGATAIPAGRYQIILSLSYRFKKTLPELLSVPGFSGIRIHAGNTTADTSGCILLGLERNGTTLTQSRAAMTKFINFCEETLAREDIYLNIK